VGEEMRDALPDVADVEQRFALAAAAVGAGQASKADLAALDKATTDLSRWTRTPWTRASGACWLALASSWTPWTG
jgi:hypothetical protein